MSKNHDDFYHAVKNDAGIMLALMFFATMFHCLRQDDTKSTNQIDSKECFGHSTMKCFTHRQKGTMQ